MKITKSQLKQIIKEELEVTLTNEEATEMFGEAVGTQLEEQELNEVDMSQVQIIMDAFAQIGLNLSPAVITGLMGYAFKQAIDADKEVHKSFNKRRRGFAKPEDQQELNELEVTDPSVALVVAAMAKMAYNFSPAVFGTIAIMAARKAMGLDDPKEVEKIVKQTAAEVQKGPPPGTVIPMGKDINRDHLDEEAKVAGDVARAGAKLGKVSGLEAALANINTLPEFEQMMMKFIQMVSATKLKPQDVKRGIAKVAKQVLQAK